MAFIPVPNGIQLCFDFVTAGQFWQFCLTLKKSSGSPDATDLENVADIGKTWWLDFRPFLTTESTLRQTRATDLTSQGGPQHIEAVGTAGTGSGDAAPIGQPVVVSLRTAKRGRSYRGRVYVSAFQEDHLDTPTDISSTLQGALIGLFENLDGDLDSAGYEVGVASRQHNGVTTNPAAFNRVTAYVVDSHLDSQRRRLAGRGT